MLKLAVGELRWAYHSTVVESNGGSASEAKWAAKLVTRDVAWQALKDNSLGGVGHGHSVTDAVITVLLI